MSIARSNPYKPGAGHPPPYLAGREHEISEFDRLLTQSTILENIVLTGLRGTGKTVLLDTKYRERAVANGWAWAGTDLSESASVGEERLALRIITDLSILTSSIIVSEDTIRKIGFGSIEERQEQHADYLFLKSAYENLPGLPADRLKEILEFTAGLLHSKGVRGAVFAYDEAQNLTDHAPKDEYPLSMLLEVFQSVQKKGIPFLLVLVGLPTLYPKLVEARTFAERMFRVVTLTRLHSDAARDAIRKPIESSEASMRFDQSSVEQIVTLSGGYPYFIQFICREAFDVFISSPTPSAVSVPVAAILRKLDSDFFAGRWHRATDRQRELLTVAARLEDEEEEFTIQAVVEKSSELLARSFSASNVSQLLQKLSDAGLVYKNRHGKYCFAVPLLGSFIRRQLEDAPLLDMPDLD